MADKQDGIIRHERTDEWKVQIDGKTYWANRFTMDGKEANWTVEVVRARSGC